MYIFLDESGDLGFSKKSSKWFLFTIAIINNYRDLEKVTDKVWKKLHQKHKHISELHASQEKDGTRRNVLSLLANIDDLKIMTIILNKEKVYINLQQQKNYLYNYTANLLMDRLHKIGILGLEKVAYLIVDRKDTKRRLRDNFIQYITQSMQERIHIDFKINLRSSHDNKSLQRVDFLSWAIFRKYEHGDFEFYEIIRDKIIDEKLLFP